MPINWTGTGSVISSAFFYLIHQKTLQARFSYWLHSFTDTESTGPILLTNTRMRTGIWD